MTEVGKHGPRETALGGSATWIKGKAYEDTLGRHRLLRLLHVYFNSIRNIKANQHKVMRITRETDMNLSQSYFELSASVLILLKSGTKEINLILNKEGYSSDRLKKIRGYLESDLRKMNNVMYMAIEKAREARKEEKLTWQGERP